MESVLKMLDEMESYLQECGNVPFSSKVIVNMEVLYEFMADIRRVVPEDVQRSKRILDERDKIVETANLTAEAIVSKAEEEAARLLDEHTIRQQAIKEAEALIDETKDTADEITGGAYKYVDDLLLQNQHVIQDLLNKSSQQFEQYERYLRSQLDVLEQNRDSLNREE